MHDDDYVVGLYKKMSSPLWSTQRRAGYQVNRGA